MIGVGLFVLLACHLGETFNIVIICEVMSVVDDHDDDEVMLNVLRCRLTY